MLVLQWWPHIESTSISRIPAKRRRWGRCKGKRQFLYLQYVAGGTTEAKAPLKNAAEPPYKRARMQHTKFFTDPTTGNPRSVTSKLSLWSILYIQDPLPNNPQWAKTFRKRFRLPNHSFLHLLQMVDHERKVLGGMVFHRWRAHGVCKNRKVSPV